MPVRRLEPRPVEQIWGRSQLPFSLPAGEPAGAIGEIWFEDSNGSNELLVKYLFTSEPLSIQVHPDDDQARMRGFARGKDEAWLILDAEPEAVIGLGPTHQLAEQQLRNAAESGSLETLVDWRPVKAGDFIYSPGGTIHAIGAGLALVEIQQNLDLTYRLYDYGRPRDLQVADAVAVADLNPYVQAVHPFCHGHGREILAHRQAFVVERWTDALSAYLHASNDKPVILIGVSGHMRLGTQAMEPGSVWQVNSPTDLLIDPESVVLVTYPGAEVRPELIGQT